MSHSCIIQLNTFYEATVPFRPSGGGLCCPNTELPFSNHIWVECGSKPVGRKHPAQVNGVYKRHPGLCILNSDKERSKKGFPEQNAIEKKSLVKHKEIFYSLI